MNQTTIKGITYQLVEAEGFKEKKDNICKYCDFYGAPCDHTPDDCTKDGNDTKVWKKSINQPKSTIFNQIKSWLKKF